MGVNSLPKTVTRQRRDCDLNPDLLRLSPALTTRLPSHHILIIIISIMLQRFNSVLLHDTLSVDLPDL